MNYYEQIDPIGEELEKCINCHAPTLNTYCSYECKHEYNQ